MDTLDKNIIIIVEEKKEQVMRESLCHINKISCDLKGEQVSWNECD